MLELKYCGSCGRVLERADAKFCHRVCYAQAVRDGVVPNKGRLRKGNPSPNKGRTLESWVGEERALEIRTRMSESSIGKAPQLRRLNEDAEVLAKRKASRRFHEATFQELVKEFRKLGWRCYTLSEYVKETRTPDAILFDGRALVALEVEMKKKWKPTAESMTRRLTDLDDQSRFFDRTSVVFPDERTDLTKQIPSLMGEILAHKRLYQDSGRSESED
jgi:hypothetical protein